MLLAIQHLANVARKTFGGEALRQKRYAFVEHDMMNYRVLERNPSVAKPATSASLSDTFYVINAGANA